MWIVLYNVSFREKLLQNDIYFNKYKIHWELLAFQWDLVKLLEVDINTCRQVGKSNKFN